MLLSYSMVLFHPAIRIWKATTVFLSAYSMCSFSWSVTPISPLQLNENAQKERNYEPLLQNGVDVCCPGSPWSSNSISFPCWSWYITPSASVRYTFNKISFIPGLLWAHCMNLFEIPLDGMKHAIFQVYKALVFNVRNCLHANVLMISLLKQRNSTVTHLFSGKINRVGEINYGWSGDFKHTYSFLPNVLI